MAIQDCGWRLDFVRFYTYLKDKYKATKAFLFIGYVAGNEALYTSLQKAGYIVIFKPTLEYKKEGRRHTKGNVDAELVLHVMIECNYSISSGHCEELEATKQSNSWRLLHFVRNDNLLNLQNPQDIE